MLGRMTYSDLPFYSPIAFSGAAAEVIAGVVIVSLVLYFRLLGPLWREWLTSVDHKRIGVMYIVMALVMLLRAFADAFMMRTQQAMSYESTGYLTPDHFNQVFSVHGTMMIFFVAMPLVTGFINLVMPLQIGTRDVSFPLLNSISLYLTASGAFLCLASLVLGKFSTGGWTGYPPYTIIDQGTGVEYWIWALTLSGLGTTISSVNFITTIVMRRAPGMTWMKMPLFSWTALVSSVQMLFAFPALTVVCLLLQSDRLFGTHFFTNEMGGNMMLYINMIWLWGHPEVYILILPAFGIFSEVVPTFARKTLFSYGPLTIATVAIGLLSFTVWLHHFFTMGASANVNAVFGIATMVIAVPTGVKIFNWIFTIYGGRLAITNAIRWTISFIILFVIGGMTGVILAVPPVDFIFHNSTFLVAHFHNVIIPGVVFGMFAGLEYWFPKAFGFKLDEKWGRRAFWLWSIGFVLAFFPLYIIGLMGMPRRMETYHNPAFFPYMIVALIGVTLILGGVVCQITEFIVSIRRRRELVDETGDPWNGRTLEWMTTSPPPPYNFAVVPQVTWRDEYWERKRRGLSRLPDKFVDIVMPKNSPFGPVIGAAAFLLGFGVTFYIWWLVTLCALTLLISVIMTAFRSNTHYVIPAEEVARIERSTYDRIRPLLRRRRAEDIKFEKATLAVSKPA